MALSRSVQGSPVAMRTGPEASKTETVNSALYVKGGPSCTQSLSSIDINKHYEVT